MSLREKINEQFNSALKSKNKNLVSTLRLVLAAIKDKDIANRTGKKREATKDEEIIKLLRKMKKQRQDSADLYKKGERLDLLQIEEEEIIKLLRKMKKQRQDSADLYKKGERLDLLQIEEEEIKIIDSFLPKQLNEVETEKICKEIIESLGASSIKDMGKIMGALKKKYSDSIDFSKVNIIVKGLLNQ